MELDSSIVIICIEIARSSFCIPFHPHNTLEMFCILNVGWSVAHPKKKCQSMVITMKLGSVYSI